MDKLGKKRILLKIGTGTLTKGTGAVSRGKLEDIGRQIVALKDDFEFIIVCSGAIAVAKQFVDLDGMGQEIKVKQALAAIGQPHLMRIIQESFRELKLLTAQALIAYTDIEHPNSKKNIVNTLNVLLQNNYIPIINENDTVATDEIKFGDNDKLAALTAVLMQVDLFVMATNTYGLYKNDPNISKEQITITEIIDLDKILIDLPNTKSEQGSGGIKSKMQAAGIAQKAGIETWLVNGFEEEFLLKAFANEVKFTKIN